MSSSGGALGGGARRGEFCAPFLARNCLSSGGRPRPAQQRQKQETKAQKRNSPSGGGALPPTRIRSDEFLFQVFRMRQPGDLGQVAVTPQSRSKTGSRACVGWIA